MKTETTAVLERRFEYVGEGGSPAYATSTEWGNGYGWDITIGEQFADAGVRWPTIAQTVALYWEDAAALLRMLRELGVTEEDSE